MFDSERKKQKKPTNPNAATSNTFVKQVCEQSCTLDRIFSVALPVHCRQGVEVPSVECEEGGVLSGECSVKSEVGWQTVECKV